MQVLRPPRPSSMKVFKCTCTLAIGAREHAGAHVLPCVCWLQVRQVASSGVGHQASQRDSGQTLPSVDPLFRTDLSLLPLAVPVMAACVGARSSDGVGK